MTIDVRAEEHARSEQRCPYCHDALVETEATARCSKCETAYHRACAAELGKCAVMGCGGELPLGEGVASPAAPRERPEPADPGMTTIVRALALIAVLPLALLTILSFSHVVKEGSAFDGYLGVLVGLTLGALTVLSFITVFEPSLAPGLLSALLGTAAARRRTFATVLATTYAGLAALAFYGAAVWVDDRSLATGIGVLGIVFALFAVLAVYKGFSSSEPR